MITNEAIKILTNIEAYLIAGNPIWDTDTIRDAMDMAIESLKQQDYTEQIRWERDIALEQLKELGYSLGEKPKQWIPCEERLPEPYDDVIISAKGYVCEANLRESKEYFLTHNARMFIKTEETDAWMPLPKAYEGRTE